MKQIICIIIQDIYLQKGGPTMERKRAEYKSSIASKNQLKRSFAELLYKTPLEKITVTAVIEGAGVSRSTFYAHYNDIDDLLTTIIHEETDKIIKCVDETGIGSIYQAPRPLLRKVADLIISDQHYYKMLYLSDKSGEFIGRMKTELTDKLLLSSPTAKNDVQRAATIKVYCDFFVSALLRVVMDFFTGEIDVSVEELIDIVATLIERAFPIQR